jgi:hypothetical protein
MAGSGLKEGVFMRYLFGFLDLYSSLFPLDENLSLYSPRAFDSSSDFHLLWILLVICRFPFSFVSFILWPYLWPLANRSQLINQS